MNTLTRRLVPYSLAAAIATATSCGSTAAPAGPSGTATDPAPGRIVVLGDSLAVSPSRSNNFPAGLQRRLNEADLRWTVVNAGVGGDTTTGGLRRFDQAIAVDPEVLVLELGANDGLRGVSIATIESNLSAMIERAQARGIRVLLCGMEIPPARGWNYTIEFHRLFPRVASKYGVPLVPFLLDGVALNPELNGDDGIHPNAAGAERIAATIWPYLVPLVQQAAAPMP